MEPKDNRSEERRQRRAARRGRRSNPVLIGAILVIVGIFLLLQQFTNARFDNWWALFILIPALSSLGGAYALYQRTGQLTSGVISSFFSGLIILAVAVIFFFNLDWATFWPIFLILPGLSILLGSIALPAGSTESAAWGFYRPWALSIGAALTLLGLGFLLQALNIFDPAQILTNWWAVLILLASTGGLLAALQAYSRRQTIDWVVVGNLLTTAVIAVVGIVALFGLNWNWLAPIILIAAGLVILLSLLRSSRHGA